MGFYLAFRDQNSCGRILRVMVYRNICPQRTEGLVIYPETPTGPTSVPVSHECTANAEVTGGCLFCTPNGTWSGSPSCGCVPGYRLAGSECKGITHPVHALILMLLYWLRNTIVRQCLLCCTVLYNYTRVSTWHTSEVHGYNNACVYLKLRIRKYILRCTV